MDPKKPTPDLIGTIPRKKKPTPPSAPTFGTTTAPLNSGGENGHSTVAVNALSAPIPRRPKSAGFKAAPPPPGPTTTVSAVKKVSAVARSHGGSIGHTAGSDGPYSTSHHHYHSHGNFHKTKSTLSHTDHHGETMRDRSSQPPLVGSAAAFLREVSQEPLVLKIRTAGLSLEAARRQKRAQQSTAVAAATTSTGKTNHRLRVKSKRPMYQDDLTDSDDDLIFDEAAPPIHKTKKRPRPAASSSLPQAPSTQDFMPYNQKSKRIRKSPAPQPDQADPEAVEYFLNGPGATMEEPATTNAQAAAADANGATPNINGDPSTAAAGGLLLAPLAIEAPPPGVLSTLWYSRECYLHVMVLDKVLGWKLRPKVELRRRRHVLVAPPVSQDKGRPETVASLPTAAAGSAPGVVSTPTTIVDGTNTRLSAETGAALLNDNHVIPAESLVDATEAIPSVNKAATLVDEVVTLDAAEALSWQQRALTTPAIWNNPRKRTEISRIEPAKCPMIMALAAEYSQSTNGEGSDTTIMKEPLRLVVYDENDNNEKQDLEEVILVKWRGRSHLHCSWERATDIQRLDPSNNTARNKIRRFYQSQEQLFGLGWKRVLEQAQRPAVAAAPGVVVAAVAAVAIGEEDEEYFSPQCLEIERILACDENELNMTVLAKQRALNRQADRQALTNSSPKKDLSARVHDGSTVGIRNLIAGVENHDTPWDPEDNVRYVIKWKGMSYAELTWEYWRDIKRDAVDQVEDFWHRQVPPDLEEARQLASRPPPQIRDFRKLQSSRSYGVSKRKRPVADLLGNEDMELEEEQEDPGFRLRSYQLEGVNWLLFNWFNKRSCILADEMGLGKTIQSATFLQELQNSPSNVRGPFLVVAPLSLVGQWQSELHSWAPDMNVVLYHGSADARDFLVKQEFFYTDQFIPKPTAVKLKKLHVTKFHVLITTYEVVLKDINVLSKIRWKTLIVDEAHRLKNSKARLFEDLANVPRDYCVLLTGTPIANATEELWALLHFANPSVFKEKDDFLEKFGQMTDADQVNELHALLRPYLLRRVKEDVEKSLPPKEETILEVSLTPNQKKFYKAIYERNTSFLFKGSKPSNAPSLMNVMMELRKCCNHPFLVKGAEDRIIGEAISKLEVKNDEHGNPIPVDQHKMFAEQLVKSSGKMVLMEKLLQKLFDGGHKVLIFSQMVRVLDLLEELLKLKKYKYERLDGSTSSSLRVHAVERFNKKSLERFVMLLSTRAGGLGLNLTAADIVVIFDSDWNPQNDLQAMARAHRIGQTRAVRVYRLLTAKTYEMHMFHSASLKLGLERAVLSQNREHAGDDGEDGQNKPNKKKSDREAQAKEIDELLKKGAYDVFRDDDDTEAEKFMETDIDQLLEHSSKTVIYGNSASSSMGSGLGSFSKASFVADTGEGDKDVDLDDPDFWSKAVGLEAPVETPEDVAAMIDDGVKRSRKQVQVYDPYAETAEAEKLKKDRLALEKMLEKEEKDRIRMEKKKKKKEAIEKKKRERDEQKQLQEEKKATKVTVVEVKKQKPQVVKPPKPPKEVKPKKSKKNDKQRALRRAENEDPVMERLKQAWEVPQRNRATAAALRFGFDRFCKLRSESNLTSLPLQDLEVFVRAYYFQIALQVAVTLLLKLRQEGRPIEFRPMFHEWLGIECPRELDWVCDAIKSAMRLQLEVESNRRSLRLPAALCERSYVTDLRNGAAFRALRRAGVLSRLQYVVEDSLDSILSSLGHEELGKRGCSVNDLASLDADLKSRYVSIEELSLAIGSMLGPVNVKPPATWWDRRCDIALVIGAFVHGLGNYESMRNDSDLPFGDKIKECASKHEACRRASSAFRTVSTAARKAFEDALESARIKAELEVQAAVAAAAKAALKREEDAALLRKGGAEAAAVISAMPDTQVENAFAFDGNDSHFVTLPRIQKLMQEAAKTEAGNGAVQLDSKAPNSLIERGKKDEENGGTEEEDASTGHIRGHHFLPMPDSRILDHRLLLILQSLERGVCDSAILGLGPNDVNPDLWQKSDDVLTNLQVRAQTLPIFYGKDASLVISEYSGIGLGANQCGSSHRTLNDGSDFSFGSAVSQLSHVAYGTDAPRFLRAIGVPMNISRFAVTALVHAEKKHVDKLLATEKLRFGMANDPMKSESTETQGSDNRRIPIDILSKIPHEFRVNAKLRAFVCLGVLFYGFPGSNDGSEMNAELCGNADTRLFSRVAFRAAIIAMAPDVEVPGVEVLSEYIENHLIPHCVKVCVYGNGPVTRTARGSEGRYETAFGISIYPEPGRSHPSPLPDPCIDIREHSLEGLGNASAIVRRVRLLRASMFLCSGQGVAASKIFLAARAKIMCALEDMPIWWCPWKHDISLLVHAASSGLFSIAQNRISHPVFSPELIEQHLRTSMEADKNSLHGSTHLNADHLNDWTKKHAAKFPSLLQLERRLAFLCAGATADMENENRYDNLPMFDHGGWPRS